jgi:hypothetical protein
LTCSEAREFGEFCARFPIDDESNFQLPMAQMLKVYSNAHRDQTQPRARITDFMPFHPKGNNDDVEDMLRDNWNAW